jgi:hypothetical protein
MAKFGRFDPRNKKEGRNKRRSLYKDIRIHENDKDQKLTGFKVTHIIIDELATLDEDIWHEDESV